MSWIEQYTSIWSADEIFTFTGPSAATLAERDRTFLAIYGLPQLAEIAGGCTLSALPEKTLDSREFDTGGRCFLDQVECCGRVFRLLAVEAPDPFTLPHNHSYVGIDATSGSIDLLFELPKRSCVIPVNTSLEVFVVSLAIYRRFAKRYWEGKSVSRRREKQLIEELISDLMAVEPDVFLLPGEVRGPYNVWKLGIRALWGITLED